jgi:hypothetical protein
MPIIAARWVLWIVAMAPAVLGGSAAISTGPAVEPYFASAPQPLGLLQLVELLGRFAPVFSIALFCVFLGWLGSQLLTAGAITVLRGPAEDGRRLWRASIDLGMPHLLAYLRIAFVAALWLGLCFWLVNRGISWLADRGELNGWSASTLLWALTVTRAAALVVLGGIVGTCALWCRVLVVIGNRRRVRRLHEIVPRLIARAPLQGLVLQVVLSSVSVIVGAAVLFAWRQSTGGTALWVVVWLLVLLGQAYVWHWRLRILCALTEQMRDRWTRVPDEPWRFLRRLWRRLPRRSPKPPVVALRHEA